LVGAYIMEKIERMSKFWDMLYYKLYQDDGLLIFCCCKPLQETESWLKDFQQEVDKLLDSSKLHFSMSV